jgi:cytochrome c
MENALQAMRVVIIAFAVILTRDAHAAGEMPGAAGNARAGATVFVRQCALCHTIAQGERNGFGPNLFGIADRKAATAPGYNYSSAFKGIANWTWSPDGIASFVVAPEKTIPGNRMGEFQGVAERDLDDLIAYLAAQKQE